MRLYTILVFIALYSSALAQSAGERILFHPTMNEQAMELGQSYYSITLEDSIQFDALKFYISDVQLYYQDQLVLSLEKTHHLIDLENPESLTIELNPNKDSILTYNNIRFNLGVDSLTNSSGAFGGDLDPTNGMYWTWQSGYINFKLEGLSKACPARKNVFQFHLGGFLGDNNAIQKVRLETSKKEQNINFAIDKLLEKINIKEQYQIMSPSIEAVEISKLVADIFTIKS